MTTNAQKVYQDLTSLGMTPAAATGVVGNLVAESGVNPLANEGAVSGQGQGIVQWSLNGRWQTLLKWAAGQGKDPHALATQEEFMINEMASDGVWNALAGQTNVTTAANIVMTKYEMPADQSAANATYRANLGIQAVGSTPAGTSGLSKLVNGLTNLTAPNASQAVQGASSDAAGAVAGAASSALSAAQSALLGGTEQIVIKGAFVLLAVGLAAGGAWKLTSGPRAKAMDTAGKLAPLAVL